MTIQCVKKMGYLAGMLCLTIPAWADVGVDKIDPDSDSSVSYVKKEGGESLPLKAGDFLPDGSKVTGGKGSFVKLTCKDMPIGLSFTGQDVPSDWEVHKKEHFPYTVDEWYCTIFGRSYEYFKQVITGTSGPTECVSSVELLSIPMLQGDEVKLVTTKEANSFYLGWKGGKAGYIIEVFELINGKQGQKIAETGLGEKTEKGDCLVLREKQVGLTKDKKLTVNSRYKVNITDSGGDKAEGTFTVVGSQREKLQGEDDVSKKCRRQLSESEVCLATWVASQSDSKWAFDAYQKLAISTTTDARNVRLSIAEGNKLVE